MSNKILIIADGKVSQSFIKRISLKGISELDYTVISQDKQIQSPVIEYIDIDPTSFFRLKEQCIANKFLSVFIIMQNPNEVRVVYKNIRKINQKIRIVLLDIDSDFSELDDSYTHIVDAVHLLSNRLYHSLPNVPLTAQSIGLNEGEIMEVMVPFASAFSYRHIGAIKQDNWKISAIYRNNELILPKRTTMIRPRDKLILIGRPNVLMSVYRRIRNKQGVFPEPFGKNFYLYLDINEDEEKVIRYIIKAQYLLDKFDNKELIIRVVNPNSMKIVDKIKEFESEKIKIIFSYSQEEGSISDDINKYDIGLILLSTESLMNNNFNKELYEYKKLVYVFGNNKISNIKEVVVTKSEDGEIEEISSVAFYIAEVLGVKLSLRDYSPNGEFEDSKIVIEHFETLAQIHNVEVNIIQERKNPIKAIRKSKNILLAIPFKKEIDFSFWSFFKRDVNSLLIRTNQHPKLLIPIE